jgi:hypothetical protein
MKNNRHEFYQPSFIELITVLIVTVLATMTVGGAISVALYSL